MQQKIGILCAGDSEAAPFLNALQNPVPSQKAMLRFVSGTLEGVLVVALYSGVCKVNAAIAAQLLIDAYGCTALINGGTAGGMAPQVKLLDTVISTEAAYWDVAPHILTQFHPWLDTEFFPSDPRLLACARQAAAHNHFSDVHFGRMVTGECFIDEEHRGEINEAYAPLSVDMETAAIAHVCHVNQVPFLAVRCITDIADHSGLGAFEENCAIASLRSCEVVRAILRQLQSTIENGD